MNTKGLSPLIATLLLVVFALVIGTATMNWGKAYVENVGEKEKAAVKEAVILIPYEKVDSDLKRLQIDYLTGKINKETYIERERELLRNQ